MYYEFLNTAGTEVSAAPTSITGYLGIQLYVAKAVIMTASSVMSQGGAVFLADCCNVVEWRIAEYRRMAVTNVMSVIA